MREAQAIVYLASCTAGDPYRRALTDLEPVLVDTDFEASYNISCNLCSLDYFQIAGFTGIIVSILLASSAVCVLKLYVDYAWQLFLSSVWWKLVGMSVGEKG